MGMFDTVKLDDYSILPVDTELQGKIKNECLQTKDFDCVMTNIWIKNGRLLIERFDYDIVPKEERPYPNHYGVMGTCGSLKKVNKELIDKNYHGVFNFYANVVRKSNLLVIKINQTEDGVNLPEDDQGDEWVEFNAIFDDGNLRTIERVSI